MAQQRQAIPRRRPIGLTVAMTLALFAFAIAEVALNWPRAVSEVSFAFSMAFG